MRKKVKKKITAILFSALMIAGTFGSGPQIYAVNDEVKSNEIENINVKEGKYIVSDEEQFKSVLSEIESSDLENITIQFNKDITWNNEYIGVSGKISYWIVILVILEKFL